MSSVGFASGQCTHLHVCKSGSTDDACQIFDKLEQRNIITWNVMICAQAEDGCGVEADQLFLNMQ